MLACSTYAPDMLACSTYAPATHGATVTIRNERHQDRGSQPLYQLVPSWDPVLGPAGYQQDCREPNRAEHRVPSSARADTMLGNCQGWVVWTSASSSAHSGSGLREVARDTRSNNKQQQQLQCDSKKDFYFFIQSQNLIGKNSSD